MGVCPLVLKRRSGNIKAFMHVWVLPPLAEASAIVLFKLWENAPVPVLTETGKWGGLAIDIFLIYMIGHRQTCTLQLLSCTEPGLQWEGGVGDLLQCYSRDTGWYPMLQKGRWACPYTNACTENNCFAFYDTKVMFLCVCFSQTRWSGTEHAV